MDRFKKVFKWWFAWEPEKVENFLECMALQGWHAAHVGGMLVGFLFEHGEPKKIRYCLDYQQQEKPEYMRIFADSGWTLLRKSMGWYLWSREYENERPEIFTDSDSLIRRNRGVLATMLVLLCTQVPLWAANVYNLSRIARFDPSLFIILVAALVAVYALLAYCVARLALSNRRLKRRGK